MPTEPQRDEKHQRFDLSDMVAREVKACIDGRTPRYCACGLLVFRDSIGWHCATCGKVEINEDE